MKNNVAAAARLPWKGRLSVARPLGLGLRYLAAEPTHPFGHGLSYGRFTYPAGKPSGQKTAKSKPAAVTAAVTNAGKMESKAAVRLCLARPAVKGVQTPPYSRTSFQRIKPAPGASAAVAFTLTPAAPAIADAQGQPAAAAGPVTGRVGGSLPGARSAALGASPAASAVLTVKQLPAT